jgi:hypothetical protein
LENKRKPILFKVTEPSSIVGGDDRITVSYEFLLHASSSIVLDQYSKALRDERWISLKFREIEEFVCGVSDPLRE